MSKKTEQTNGDSADLHKLTFSQREGLEPIPEPLKLGKLSKGLRAKLWHIFHSQMRESLAHGPMSSYLDQPWRSIAIDWEVTKYARLSHTFDSTWSHNENVFAKIFSEGRCSLVLDFIEFVLRHRKRSLELRSQGKECLAEYRAAYTVVDGDTICAIGTEEQGEAIKQAFRDLADHPFGPAKEHLKKAAVLFNQSKFSDSIRESIHAVESVARLLVPRSNTLPEAMTPLAQKAAIHPALKKALLSMYGYTSDLEGIRHSLVYEDKSDVDEVDALFMIGACASFISYLIGKGRAAGFIRS